jgi:hypothetical protein
MNLWRTRLGDLWLGAARSRPQQAEGEPPDKESVESSGRDQIPKPERM